MLGNSSLDGAQKLLLDRHLVVRATELVKKITYVQFGNAGDFVEKMHAAQKVTTDFVLEDSLLITNVGRFALPESCRPYVLDYGAILPCAVQPFALLISSYGDKMKLSVAQRDHDMQVVEDLCAGLRQLGIQPETLSYPFVVTRYNGLECGM